MGCSFDDTSYNKTLASTDGFEYVWLNDKMALSSINRLWYTLSTFYNFNDLSLYYPHTEDLSTLEGSITLSYNLTALPDHLLDGSTPLYVEQYIASSLSRNKSSRTYKIMIKQNVEVGTVNTFLKWIQLHRDQLITGVIITSFVLVLVISVARKLCEGSGQRK